MRKHLHTNWHPLVLEDKGSGGLATYVRGVQVRLLGELRPGLRVSTAYKFVRGEA